MRKLTILFALLCATMMSWATDYCHTEMTTGGKTIYLTCQEISAGNYQLKVECNEAMSGLGGSFCEVNGVGGYQLNADGHFTLSGDGKTITCDIASSSAPRVYTPLYVLIDGEKNFGEISDASWAACGGGSTPDPDPDPTPDPDPNSYTAGGHTIHLEAYHINDIYTLNITSTDNMEGLGGSFWNVNGVGADMRTNTGTSSYTVSGDKKTITCQVQSSSAPNIYTPLYVLMPGEVNFGNVTLNWEDRTPITSEYCNYQGPETQQDNHYYAITWETDPSGNVVITIGNGTGAGACSFRNGGFEGGNNGLNNFVVSDDNFATTTPATDYFTVTRPSDGDLQYVMTKIADLPANAKIKHLSAGAIAWKEGGVDRWCFPEFIYTYGGTCNQLDAPTNVAIDANNILTFDAVAGADSYMAYVSLGGVEKYSQAVASGDELTYTALVTGDYIINVVASGAGKVDSDPSADVVWHLEAAPVVLGNSEYCEHVFMADDNREAAFTWETDADGNIVITISATRGDAAATHFRGNGMALANFKVGAGKADASTYFNHACGGSNQVTLSLKNPANAPALGEKIYFNNTVEYATSLDGNAWPTLNFEWTYGTICSGKSVSASVNNNTMGSAVVQKAGVDVTNVDAGDEVSFIATSADPALYRFVNWTKGGVEVSTEATYVATITETTNLVANFDYIRETYCQYEILATGGAAVGKKLYMTIGSIGGGKYQIKYEGSAEAPLLALNNANYMVNNVSTDIEYIDPVSGNPVASSGGDVPFTKANGRWSFDATGNGSAKMEFELASGKTINDIFVWGNSVAFATPLGELVYEDNQTRLGLFGNPAPLRHNIDWDATCSDTEAPVMVSAALDHKTASSAILNVSATDAHLDAYHVEDAVNGIDVVVPAAAQITIEGLVGGTTYNLTVKAVDVTGNESTSGINVEVVMAATVSAPTTAPAAPEWPAGQVISFYSDTYTAPNTWNFRAPWGGSTVYEQVVIEGNNIIHYSTLDYVGWIYEAGGTPYNAINMEKLHLDIWVADDCTIGIVPIYGGDGLTTDDNKRKKPALTGQQWNSIDLDLATDYAGLNLASIFQFKFDQATTTEFWVDNVYFYRTTELVDNEAPTNVSASVAETGFYSVKITAQAEDNMGSVNFSVMNGAVEVATGASVSGVPTTITVSNLTPGTAYNFTVIAKDDKPNEAASVAVNATTKALPATAPTPDFSGKLVIPVFTDAMAGAPAPIHSGGWGEATIHEWLNLSANDKVFYVQNLNYAGWHSWGADIDATGMQFFHVDVYSLGATSVNVTPISHDPTQEGSYTIELTPNAWTSVDVPLSAYANIEWNKIFQFKFMWPEGGNELMIDNVYFWKNPDYKRDASTGDDWMAPGELGTVCIPQGAVATGGDLYTLEGKNSDGKIVFATVPNNEMQPGVPYLFQATSNAMNFFYTDAIPATEPDNSGAMKSTFEDNVVLSGDQLNGVYYFNGHALWSAASLTELPVVKYRAYVKMDAVHEINTSNSAPGRRYIIMDVHGQNATTGFGEIQGDEVYTKVLIDGKLFILRGEKMYNANGQLVK
ncbi:MAG: fibronectin type III domain-containing protein [Paludibacteraceae bacterium]|nr:fibronectin type III domain-containing protein [Paludibacteraceae bacterium]